MQLTLGSLRSAVFVGAGEDPSESALGVKACLAAPRVAPPRHGTTCEI